MSLYDNIIFVIEQMRNDREIELVIAEIQRLEELRKKAWLN